MDNECKLQIQRIEIDVANQGLRLDTQELRIKEQGDSLDKITQILSQVRWMMSGALLFYVMQKIGLWAVLEKLLGM